MNKKQLRILGLFFLLLGILFFTIALDWQAKCYEILEQVSVTCIRGQVFAPYPYIFFGLSAVFMILSLLDEKK